MPGDKYELHGRPIPPADLNADVMTAQESAFVLKCSVSHLRRGINTGKCPHSRSGRRLVTNRTYGGRIYEIDRVREGRRRPATTATAGG